jgi:hypothetical protein
MMPDILKQVGPQQYQFLKSQLGNLDGGKAEAEDDDDVPNLVGTFEDAGKKWVSNQALWSAEVWSPGGGVQDFTPQQIDLASVSAMIDLARCLLLVVFA